MLAYPVILAVSAVGLALISVIVYLTSGSIFAVLIVLTIAGILVFLLQTFGILSIKTKNGGLEIDFHEKVPAPHDNKHKGKTLNIKEVFHISDNLYTYEEAPAVCAAYGAELATYDQITEAFSLGAEWCGYGWSAAAMALYPTQESTWSTLQMEPQESRRTACGHPGVNGGYFDPRMKFGVNCYGTKPHNKGTKLPLPVPGTDSKQFDRMVDKFKSMLNSIKLSPFNRDIWSESNIGKEMKQHSKDYISGAERDIKSAWETVEKDVESL